MATEPGTTAVTGHACPNCGQQLAGGNGWPVWCRNCDWGVDPNPLPEEPSRVHQWWQRRIADTEGGEHEALMAKPGVPPGDGGARVLAFTLAALIQLGTLLLVALGVGIWFTGVATFAQVIISLLAFLIAAAVAPLSRRSWQDEARPTGWTRGDAPNTFTLLDEVAQVAGSPVPARVAVNEAFNASITRARQQTTLTVGLPLWECLDDDSRISLLGHELGDTVNHDIRHNSLIHASTITCQKWLALLSPDPIVNEDHIRRQKMRSGRPGRASGSNALGDRILRVVLIPFYLAAVGVAYLYTSAVTRCGQRAEYRSDLIALRVGGSAGTAELMDAYARRDTVAFQLSAAARREDSGLLASFRTSLADVPEDERERIRRLSQTRLQRVDASHPPTIMRAQYFAAAGHAPASPIDHALFAAATAELRRETPEVERRLRNQAGE
jgi:Zn-dependent protease with chaperone function